MRVTHQSGACAATHQAHTGPQVGADFQVFAAALGPPCVQGSHAALAFGIHAGKHGLGAHHGVVADVADEFFGGGPGLLVRLTHDDVQADAELHGAAVLGGTGTHIGHFLGDLCGRLAPGQIRLDLLGREVVRGGG